MVASAFALATGIVIEEQGFSLHTPSTVRLHETGRPLFVPLGRARDIFLPLQ
jgi:hypothetical protein